MKTPLRSTTSYANSVKVFTVIKTISAITIRNTTWSITPACNANKVFRTLRSFDEHQTSHNRRHTCEVCSQSFLLKTTLHNHMAVHSNTTLSCSHPGCSRTFRHRANQLEHISYGHRKMKDVPCSHCAKMFKMLTSMRAHRIVYHGYVPDITPGHPLSSSENVFPSSKVKDKYGKKKPIHCI